MQEEKIIEVTLGTELSTVSIISKVEKIAKEVQVADLLLLDRSLQEHSLLMSLVAKKAHLVLSGGESVKTQSSLKEITNAFFEHSLIRTSKVIVIGGGALCDSTAFAVSMYMRGIKYSLIPTTLLAMVDASIGGKTAINMHQYKNSIGTFYPPQKVIVCPEFLHTLSSRQCISGLAEILKAGMLYDAIILHQLKEVAESFDTAPLDIFTVLKEKDHKTLLFDLIERAILVKKMVVEADFKEQSIRSHLNLGHTFAHAIERNARKNGIDILHGEAVGLGLRSAMMLGMQLGITNSSYAEYIYSLLDALGFQKDYAQFDIEDMISSMKRDKKVDSKGLRFILQKEQGETEIVHVDEATLHEHFVTIKKLQNKSR